MGEHKNEQIIDKINQIMKKTYEKVDKFNIIISKGRPQLKIFDDEKIEE